MTSPPPTRLNLSPKLRLNYWPDISQTEVSMILIKEKTLPSWVDAGVEFDSEELLEREGRGRKPSFPPEKEENFKIELDHM